VMQVSSRLNMSKHTLARRLKAAATSYGQLLERVRRDKALSLLLKGHVPVDAIAVQLGFKETGSFSRAFKRWCHCSPTQYRERGGSAATNG
jgi:AraC-like DNA-binding protein